MKHPMSRSSPPGTVQQPGRHGTVRCRVCLKTVSPGESMLEVGYRGAHYPVCCPSCAEKFKASPMEFLAVD